MQNKKNKNENLNGFSNIGKFYKYINGKEFSHLSVTEKAVYLLIAEYSFGYSDNIQFAIQLSLENIVGRLKVHRQTASKTLKSLIEKKLIKRVKLREFGAKQSYRYSVVLPKGYHIYLGEEYRKKKNIDISECV